MTRKKERAASAGQMFDQRRLADLAGAHHQTNLGAGQDLPELGFSGPLDIYV